MTIDVSVLFGVIVKDDKIELSNLVTCQTRIWGWSDEYSLNRPIRDSGVLFQRIYGLRSGRAVANFRIGYWLRLAAIFF